MEISQRSDPHWTIESTRRERYIYSSIIIIIPTISTLQVVLIPVCSILRPIMILFPFTLYKNIFLRRNFKNQAVNCVDE